MTIVPETAPTRVAISVNQCQSVTINGARGVSSSLVKSRQVSSRVAAQEVNRRVLEQGRAAVHHEHVRAKTQWQSVAISGSH